MRMAASTLAGALLALASAMASAEGVDWVAKGTEGALVAGGRDAQGVTLRVCRAITASSVLVGQFWTEGDRAWECHVGAEGGEQVFSDFDMLVVASKADVASRWVPGHATSYPQHSLIAGQGNQDGGRWLVCAALNLSDNSVHPGYIYDENCVYAAGGRQAAAETYLVLASNDPEEATTAEAQPALEGFDPGAILRVSGFAAFCALGEGLCAAALPAVPGVAAGN
jgi:hypothetical protein